MAAEIVSATTGVMNPLLGKLTNLLGEEYRKLKGVREQASYLRVELSTIKALLDRMELVDKLDPSAKNWRDHVREMSYDMENCIDDFMHDIDGADAEEGFVRKIAMCLRRLGRRHKIANQIKQLKLLAVEANARRERYKLDDCVDSSPGVVPIDPRISAFYKENAGLVAIDGPSEELVSLLMDSQPKLKVVSIVGFGGLGKTTLAKQVYDKIGEQFDCKAVFSISQRPDVKSLLIGLEDKLGMKKCSHSYQLQLQDIIDRLREYLKHKRYIILVDDLWDHSAWDIISCAFLENSNGSRVMVTTRLDDVALFVSSDRDCIYRMKYLNEEDSRRLFFYRVFGSGNVCPPEFKEISAQILDKCGGLPLAIVTIASLLASHEAISLNEWESIKNSLGAKLSTKPSLQEMRGILNLSYMHLPLHLRPCLLYLGMYPEDREIGRDEVVQQWRAEGFVYSMHGVDLDDVGKSYFNELINRSLIQAEERLGSEIYSCRVHDMMLDLILSKCEEENFIRVAYNYEDMARLHNCEYKVRRLSFKPSVGYAPSDTLATSMSQVRSYARFGDSKYIPPLSQFKYLRVLMFECPYNFDATVDLTAIGHLFLLRYLKVLAISASVNLPAKIQGLVHLESMELVCESTESFPSDITHLVNLFHLFLPGDRVLPKGIKNMKSIRTLHCSGMSESSLEDIKGLGELTNLKELSLYNPSLQNLTVERADALVSSIVLLRDLKRLIIDCGSEWDDYERLSDSLSDPPPRLETLDLEAWKFSRVPRWIGELRCLRHLLLSIVHLSSDEVRVLGELPLLAAALFRVLGVSQQKIVVGTGLFPVLEEVRFCSDEDVSAFLSFEAGGMPKLQKLQLTLGWEQWQGDSPVGMEHLHCLQYITVRLHVADAESSMYTEDVHTDIESAFKKAVRLHPKHPSVTVY